MATVSIKCPNCGGALELDDSREFGFCIYCGTQVHIQDEKARVEVSGSVKLDESDKYRNCLTLATRAFEARNMSEAYKYYTKALEINQNDYLPVFRKGLCAGYLSDDFGLRVEEVVSGVSTAFGMATDLSIRKRMSDDIVAYAISCPTKETTAFYSSDECASYVKGVYNRVTLLNRLYAFVDKDNAESTLKYIEIAEHCCKLLNMKTLQFIAGQRVKKGKSETVYGTYPVPQNIVAEATEIGRRFAEENNKYIQPKIEMIKAEIEELKKQTNALPKLQRAAHYVCSWWVALIGLLLTPVGIGIVIWAAQIVMLIVSRAADKDKVASGLYKQITAKKKEVLALNRRLK